MSPGDALRMTYIVHRRPFKLLDTIIIQNPYNCYWLGYFVLYVYQLMTAIY